MKNAAITTNEERFPANEAEQRVLRGGTAFDLLEFEFVGPSDHRAPDEHIHQHNDGDHGGKTPKHGAGIAAAGGGLKERAETGQAEVLIAEDKHFAGHEEEPAAGDGHHGIPDQADGGERKIEFEKTLPRAEAVDDGGFAQVARNGFQGGIETESDVPDLAGEDEDDGAEFDAKLTAGENGNHGQHDSGKKTQNRNGLQNVEERESGSSPRVWILRRRSRRPAQKRGSEP